MKNYLSILFVLSLTFNTFIFAQDAEDEAVEVSTVEALLMLVKEGKTAEQTENSKREAKFVANKNKQDEINEDEKREITKEERNDDKIEEKYKKYEKILRVKEESY